MEIENIITAITFIGAVSSMVYMLVNLRKEINK